MISIEDPIILTLIVIGMICGSGFGINYIGDLLYEKLKSRKKDLQ